MTLEEAQRAKFRHVCEKLVLGSDDHVLEIGCGWGGFAIQAATEYGCRVTGLTLSPSQAALARERVAAAGLDDRVEIRRAGLPAARGAVLEDRLDRDARGDRARRVRHLLRAPSTGCSHRTASRCVQTIGVAGRRFERYRRRPTGSSRRSSPARCSRRSRRSRRAVARTRLQINGVEEIGVGYARTLREWRQNVDSNVERIRALGYDERFLRIWNFYLSYCEAGFAIRVAPQHAARAQLTPRTTSCRVPRPSASTY